MMQPPSTDLFEPGVEEGVSHWTVYRKGRGAVSLRTRGTATHHVTNRLLDLHKLFDLGLIGIDLSHHVVAAEVLRKTVYGAFDGQKMNLPPIATSGPTRTYWKSATAQESENLPERPAFSDRWPLASLRG
jgi:hypothetical protein